MASSKLATAHSFRDPIHGTIRLTREERDIVDHSLFRRLHRIRQNGLLYYVFPAATHTRFEHSLGVLHVADEAFSSLISNAERGASKAPPSVSADPYPGQAVAFHELDAQTLTAVRRVARLAALVHDLGHGPFSHTFDSFAPTFDEVIAVLEGSNYSRPRVDSLVVALKRGRDEERRKAQARGKTPKGRAEHEFMSCVLFFHIWESSNEKDDASVEDILGLVASVILGWPEVTSNVELRPFIPLLHDLIASAPVDADRMDYLERDSRSIGVTYGLFDRERLMDSFLVYRDEGDDGGDDGKVTYRLGIKESGLRAVENFVQARFELFAQIYYHKTNHAIQEMLEQVAELAGPTSRVVRADSMATLVESYLALSDERFMGWLQGKDPQAESPLIELNLEDVDVAKGVELAGRVAQRQLWKRVFESRKAGQAEIVRAGLDNQFELDDSSLKQSHMPADAVKGLDDGARILQRTKEGVYNARRQGGGALAKWGELSVVIQALHDDSKHEVRLYLTSPPGSDACEMLSAIRSEAREIARTFPPDPPVQ